MKSSKPLPAETTWPACRCGPPRIASSAKEPAGHLQKVSTELRTKMCARPCKGRGRCRPKPSRMCCGNSGVSSPSARKAGDWSSARIQFPAVMQMLCVENSTVRQMVVDHLGENDEQDLQPRRWRRWRFSTCRPRSAPKPCKPWPTGRAANIGRSCSTACAIPGHRSPTMRPRPWSSWRTPTPSRP